MLSVCALLALSISALAALLTALWPGQLAGFLIAMVAVLPGVGAYLITDNGRHSNPIATTAGLVMPLSILIIALSLFFRSGPTPSASAAEQTGESATTAPGKPEAKVDLLADASRYPLTSAVVSVYPNHIIVFPTQGTIRENVEQILKSIFPADKVTTIRGDTAQRDAQRTTLLKEQLKQSLDSIKDLGKLSELLSALAAKQIRFKGYIPSDPKEAIVRIIQRGGVFTFSVSADPVLPKERHGSLLHTNGIDQLVGRGKITGAEQRNLLHLFRRAVQDYAFMTDALSVVGERPAFLIYIGRSPEAHEDAMAKLLHRMDNPVFVPRTPPRLFDAVDPTEDVGGGSATYTLRLPRQCWWRWVGARDRKGLKRGQQLGNLRWRPFMANEVIKWEPSNIEYENGDDRSVASYDIAISIDKKVVVFRNQRLFIRPKREDVERLATEYVKSRLGLAIKGGDECVNVRAQQGGQFVGTLLYSSLADLAIARTPGGDVEVYPQDDFAKKRDAEDVAIN